MPVQRGSQKIIKRYRGSQEILASYRGGQKVYSSGLPKVVINGTGWGESQAQFRQACVDYGTTYDTVTKLPFAPDTSQATHLGNLFLGCVNLVEIPPLDLGNALHVFGLFAGCRALASAPPMTILPGASSIEEMFYNCSSLTSIPDLGDFPYVTSVQGMFSYCSSLVTAPRVWAPNSTSIRGVFQGCSNLTYAPPLSTSNATDIALAVQGCAKLTKGNVTFDGRNPNVLIAANDLAGSGLALTPFAGADDIISSPSTPANNAWTTIKTHTVTQGDIDGSGRSVIGWWVVWTNSNGIKNIRVRKNGTQIATANQSPESWLYAEQQLAVGDTISFDLLANSTTGSNRAISKATWGVWKR